MKMKTVLVLAFAVGCGLIAMMGVQQMISKQANQGQEQPVQVLVATADISPGVLLSPQNCEFKDLPAQGIPADAVRNKEQYYERGLLVPVMAGDIIRMTKLGKRGDIAASASIPTGMRTVSIQVNDTKTHSGLLQPGDRVDLQVTYECRTADGGRLTKSAILLEYIEVFASDAFRNLEAGESKEIKAKNITLLVTPEQANYIQLANTKGELIPIMRSKTDKTFLYPNGIDEVVLSELRTGMELDQTPAEEKEVAVAPVAEEPLQDFKEFLDQGIVEQQPEPAKPANTWTITIYAGEDVITQDVALPVGYEETDGEVLPTRNQPPQTVRPQTAIPRRNPSGELQSPQAVPQKKREIATQPQANADLVPPDMKKTLQGLFDHFRSGGNQPTPRTPTEEAPEPSSEKREARYLVPRADTSI